MFNMAAGVLSSLLRDKTAWIGGIASTIANIATKPTSIKLPDTLEGWGAFTVSLATVVYLVTKTVMLLRDRKK